MIFTTTEIILIFAALFFYIFTRDKDEDDE